MNYNISLDEPNATAVPAPADQDISCDSRAECGGRA